MVVVIKISPFGFPIWPMTDDDYSHDIITVAVLSPWLASKNRSTNELVSKLKQKIFFVLRWTVHHYERHIIDTQGDKSHASPSRALGA